METESPTITKVERFVTADGIEHETFAKATAHCENRVEQALRPMIQRLSTVSGRDRMDIISYLIANRAAIRDVLNF